MPDTIPEPRKIWREEARPKENVLLDFEAPERVSNERYKTFPNGYDVDAFCEKWRDPKEVEIIGTPTATISCSDATEMKNFIDEQLQRWGFPSTEEFQAKMKNLRLRYQRQLDHCLSKKKEEEIRRTMRDHLRDEKKSRRRIRHQFQLEWKFATASIVSGLKYDPMSNTFAARLDYWEISSARKKTRKETTIPVSEEWIKEAQFDRGVIQHVIDLGLVNDFVEVPRTLGHSFMVHLKKIHRLRYVHPSTMWVPKFVGGKKRMVSEVVPGYWMVMFEGERKAMKVDDDFLKDLPAKFLSEVKRMHHGFVDIPVGDFKVSHVQQHPNLVVNDAPSLRFRQSDGEDLCVSKALASVLHILGFTEQAQLINQYGKTQLEGGSVHVLKKVGQFATLVLPPWIQRKELKKSKSFDWQRLKEKSMERSILVGVLTESDGNASHAIAIHGGFVYDANESFALPLCKEALDYCCSTQEIRNEFLHFQKGMIFSYTGTKQEKVNQMTLGKLPQMSCSFLNTSNIAAAEKRRAKRRDHTSPARTFVEFCKAKRMKQETKNAETKLEHSQRQVMS